MENNDLYVIIGKKIRARRKLSKMTISDLAKALNKSISTVSKYETGSIPPSLEDLLEICSILKMDFYSLIPDNYVRNLTNDSTRYSKYFVDKAYIYWYNGEKDIIQMAIAENNNLRMKATMYFDAKDETDYYDSNFIYHGEIYYSDTNVVWVLHNEKPPFDIVTIRIPSLKPNQISRNGLMTCITYFYQNIAVKVAVSETPLTDRDFLMDILEVSRNELKSIRDSNFFRVW